MEMICVSVALSQRGQLGFVWWSCHKRDKGEKFKRWSEAPIIGPNRINPFINTAPWVLKEEDEYKMYYTRRGVHADLPRYNIQMASSTDAKEWVRTGHIAIDFAAGENALARPYVLKKMVYTVCSFI